MKLSTYRINSEIEFHKITSALDELKISYTYKTYTDTSFPVLGQGKPFADISIEKDSEADVENLIRGLTNSKPQKLSTSLTNEPNKKNKIWSVLLISYSIIVTILLFKYWYIYTKNTGDKNHTVEWSIDGQDLIMKDKKTGKIASIATDANYDLNFEYSSIFSKDGIKIIESEDSNEDGFYDRTFLYNLKGEFIGVQFDLNNDGIHENIQMILQNKDTLKLVDTNNDGFLEIKE